MLRMRARRRSCHNCGSLTAQHSKHGKSFKSFTMFPRIFIIFYVYHRNRTECFDTETNQNVESWYCKYFLNTTYCTKYLSIFTNISLQYFTNFTNFTVFHGISHFRHNFTVFFNISQYWNTEYWNNTLVLVGLWWVPSSRLWVSILPRTWQGRLIVEEKVRLVPWEGDGLVLQACGRFGPNRAQPRSGGVAELLRITCFLRPPRTEGRPRASSPSFSSVNDRLTHTIA